jgi:hypothetical protein
MESVARTVASAIRIGTGRRDRHCCVVRWRCGFSGRRAPYRCSEWPRRVRTECFARARLRSSGDGGNGSAVWLASAGRVTAFPSVTPNHRDAENASVAVRRRVVLTIGGQYAGWRL